MAHDCPDCGMHCHCNGDIDDINFGESYNCKHCYVDESSLIEIDCSRCAGSVSIKPDMLPFKDRILCDDCVHTL